MLYYTHNASLQKKIETEFEKLARFIFRNRLKSLFIIFLFTALVASNIPKINVDTSTEGFLHEDDPALINYYDFKEQFGMDQLMVIAINPEDIFSIPFLKKLKAFHDELEVKTPYLHDITSLINARNTRGEGDELIVEDLLKEIPENEKQLKHLKKIVLNNAFYKNALVSEDGKFTTILLKMDSYISDNEEDNILAGFDDISIEEEPDAKKIGESITDKEYEETIKVVEDIIAKYHSADFPISLAGSPVVVGEIKKGIMKDMRKFMILAIFTISIVLFILFRRLSGVFIPLLTVILSLMITIGFMAILGVSIKTPTSILPSFLLAVGVGDAVHILALFYRKYDKELSKEEAIVYALGHSGLPVVMTSLTTAVGLASFATADVSPIADLGFFSCLGVMTALLYTALLIPALASLAPIKRKNLEAKDHHLFMDDLLAWVANFSLANSKSIISISVIIMILSAASASLLRFSHNPLKWLPENMQIRKDTVIIDHNLKGSTSLEVLIDTKKENGLYEPDVLNRLETIKKSLESIGNEKLVGKTITITDMLKEINQALHGNNKKFYSIPQNRELIAQELLLFENSGSDDLEDVVDSQFSEARFTIKMPWLDALVYADFVGKVENIFFKAFNDDAKIKVTGIISVLGRTLQATMISAGKSYLIAFTAITFMMIILLGDLKLGLISMIPNLAPILFIMGIMQAASFPLDMFTMLIGSIAIGLAVDDTVHFMHNFKRYYKETGDVREAVHHTMHTAGRAMVVTTIVLASGFFLFTFSFMSNIFNFGVLTGATIVMALLADFMLAPALMVVLSKK